MNMKEFWNLINGFANQPEDKQIIWLKDELVNKSVQDIMEFRKIYFAIEDELYMNSTLAQYVASLFPEKGVMKHKNFCIWLIAQGYEKYIDVLNRYTALPHILKESNIKEPYRNDFAGFAAACAYLDKRQNHINGIGEHDEDAFILLMNENLLEVEEKMEPLEIKKLLKVKNGTIVM